MGLFSRKEKVPVGVAAPLAEEDKLIEDAGPAERICIRQLEKIFSEHQDCVVMKFYIENFKSMNELFGYEYCEELLNQVLEFLNQELHTPVYHYIGVEFVAILPDASMREAQQMAKKVAARFESGWKIGDTDCICSIQVGLCSCPGHPTNVPDLLKCLDMAVSQATGRGANQYAVYDDKLHAQHIRRQAITLYLGTAVENQEIKTFYRPVFNVEKQCFDRAEFRMKIFVKGIGMIGSAEFTSIAEDSGQIRKVGYYALNQVASLIARLVREEKEFDLISLPISSVLLLQEDFLEEISRVLEDYKIPPQKLALEIDEFALSTAYSKTVDVMQELSDMGVEITLNHFGSGGSGLSQVFELPVQALKLDRMFIWQLETTPKSEPIIEGLCHIAQNLGIKIIAAGVETQKQFDALNRFGCNLQQGMYYAPSVPEDVILQAMSIGLPEMKALLEQRS